MPFTFVENRGQSSGDIRFIGTGEDFKAWYGDRSVTFQQGGAHMRMSFAGGRRRPEIRALDPLGAKANYLRGSDKSRWRTDLPLFGGLEYVEVWPGIDVRFNAGKNHQKSEYVVEPGGNVSDIRLAFEGAPKVTEDGGLAVEGPDGIFREEAPFIYQESEGGKEVVHGWFRLHRDGTVGFAVRGYDTHRPLVIDPVLVFSGYVGGTSQTQITSVVVDSAYNVLVAGWTSSSDLPGTGGMAQSSYRGGVDAFVAAFSPAGGALEYCTYIGGGGDDRAFGLAVDSSGNPYVTGWTQSSNFPVSHALQSRLSGIRDAFVAKLNATGNAFLFSTYLGGTGVDSGNAIGLDSHGAPVIVGDSTSTNLPVTAGAFQVKSGGGQDVFVAKLSAAGALTALTYYGGSALEHVTAVKLDYTDAVVFGGSTMSGNLPVASAVQPKSGGGQDAFYAKLSADCARLLIGSYYGGSGGSPSAPEQINAIALRPGGTIVVGGITGSIDFPINSIAYQPKFGGGNTDGFLGRFNVTGGMEESTYFGGSSDDGINVVGLDATGLVFFGGYTTSTDFPVLNPVQSSLNGSMDGFLTKFTWGKLLYSTYLGGAGSDAITAMAIDSMTSAVVAGTTTSANFPVTGSLQGWTGAPVSSFLAKITAPFTAAVASAPSFLIDTWHNTGYNGTKVTLTGASFGVSGDLSVAGDWDGTGWKRIGVFRAGTWILDMNGNGIYDAGDKTVVFGQAGDQPVVGDWTGTGKIKLGLFRSGTFILDLSGHLSGVPTGLADAVFPFGQAADVPVAADWNQSGTTKVGVFRNGLWLIDLNGDRVYNNLDAAYTFGQAGDLPVLGDWSGNGVTKIGVYRNGLWILDYSGYNALKGTQLTFGFGGTGYVPLVL